MGAAPYRCTAFPAGADQGAVGDYVGHHAFPPPALPFSQAPWVIMLGTMPYRFIALNTSRYEKKKRILKPDYMREEKKHK